MPAATAKSLSNLISSVFFALMMRSVKGRIFWVYRASFKKRIVIIYRNWQTSYFHMKTNLSALRRQLRLKQSPKMPTVQVNLSWSSH